MNSIISAVLLKITNPKVKQTPQQQQEIQDILHFAYAVLGKLFVQNYRLFNFKHNTLTLYKRSKKQTKYLFLIFVKKSKLQARINQNRTFQSECLEQIKKFKLEPIEQYEVMYAFLDSLKTILQIHQKQYKQIQESLLARSEQNNEDLAIESKTEFKQLKKIVSNYIDRIGRINKEIVRQQIRSYQLSFQIKILLQTINQILALELLNSEYTSVESQHWSKYDTQEREYKYKRRDTVLKGSGKVLLIDWIFSIAFEDYASKQYESQIRKTLKDYQQKYRKAEMKIYRIENRLNKTQTGYIYTSKRYTTEKLEVKRERENEAREKKEQERRKKKAKKNEEAQEIIWIVE